MQGYDRVKCRKRYISSDLHNRKLVKLSGKMDNDTFGPDPPSTVIANVSLIDLCYTLPLKAQCLKEMKVGMLIAQRVVISDFGSKLLDKWWCAVQWCKMLNLCILHAGITGVRSGL